jgi:GDPmannose 4,6-dehydratase
MKRALVIDPRYFRPAEVDLLIGDASKAQRELGWTAKVGIEELVAIMMENDLKEASQVASYGKIS